jgi:hypothetical protein
MYIHTRNPLAYLIYKHIDANIVPIMHRFSAVTLIIALVRKQIHSDRVTDIIFTHMGHYDTPGAALLGVPVASVISQTGLKNIAFE